MARTAVAAAGSSGLTPHHAQVSTATGGVGATAALARWAGRTATTPSNATTSAIEPEARLGMDESLEVKVPTADSPQRR